MKIYKIIGNHSVDFVCAENDKEAIQIFKDWLVPSNYPPEIKENITFSFEADDSDYILEECNISYSHYLGGHQG